MEKSKACGSVVVCHPIVFKVFYKKYKQIRKNTIILVLEASRSTSFVLQIWGTSLFSNWYIKYQIMAAEAIMFQTWGNNLRTLHEVEGV